MTLGYEKLSLILENPPFAGSLDKEAVSKDLLVTTNTTKTGLDIRSSECLVLSCLKIKYIIGKSLVS